MLGLISPSFVISDTIDQIDQFLNASEENNPPHPKL